MYVTLMQTAFRFTIIENKLHVTQESQELILNQPSRLKNWLNLVQKGMSHNAIHIVGAGVS